MAKSKERLLAYALRKTGKSVLYISQKLGVAKSTASIWCRDISLTPAQRLRLRHNSIVAGHKGRMIGAMQNHQKKIETIHMYQGEGKKIMGKMSIRDQLLLGVGLYWAEGNRKGAGFGFVNSDPRIITFISKWLQKNMGVQKENFIPRIYINEIHKPRKMKILKFWSTLLQLPPSQFRRTCFIKTPQKKIYENYDNYYGMLALKVKSGTYLKYKIMGLIDTI